jgi:hypothetical protein
MKGKQHLHTVIGSNISGEIGTAPHREPLSVLVPVACLPLLPPAWFPVWIRSSPVPFYSVVRFVGGGWVGAMGGQPCWPDFVWQEM